MTKSTLLSNQYNKLIIAGLVKVILVVVVVKGIHYLFPRFKKTDLLSMSNELK